MEATFSGTVIEWRGPAPHHFVPLPEDVADDVADLAPLASYGWGCVPVSCTLGGTTWTTSLIPRGETYLLPLRLDVRRREGVGLGDGVTVTLRVEV